MCKVCSRSISFYETKFTIQTVHTTTLKSSVILAAPRREFDFFCCGNVQRICQHFKSDSWCAQLIIRHNGVKSFLKLNFRSEHFQVFELHRYAGFHEKYLSILQIRQLVQLIIRRNGVNSFTKENYCQIFHSHAFSKDGSFDFFWEYIF